ncbi:MAG: hypothetical protein G01um10148_187 [Parcubacteria group bacterium Gr01-1014_8]|nr:MAG: hypothetical protein G01um10148_187 [Parcubacteria group bacterium Gr01-1014_8]
MKNLTFIKDGGWLSMTIAVVVGVFAVVGLVQAATTISTNVSTDGNLSVTGTASVTGLTTLGQASSTRLSVTDTAYFGGTATTTITSAGNVSVAGTLTVTGAGTHTGLASFVQASSTRFSVFDTAYFGGSATSTFSSTGALTLITDLTLQNGEVISNSTNGTVSIGGASDILKILGTASTSALKVGDEPAAPTINGMVIGYCSFSDVASFTASTTKYFDCTTTPAGALISGDRVFVQATSSFDSPFIIQAASTTGVSTINLRVLNTGMDGAADTTLGGTSINFWAVR